MRTTFLFLNQNFKYMVFFENVDVSSSKFKIKVLSKVDTIIVLKSIRKTFNIDKMFRFSLLLIIQFS